MLLLGPTGAGKTPLGSLLHERGLAGRRYVHFDCGENLRQAVARNQPDSIVSAADIEFLRQVLQTGALLEDKDFPLAERILRSFLARVGAEADTLVVLNGLPRHVGQATALARILDVRTVVVLDCSPATVLARIATNTGGDRTHRSDDDLDSVRRKLEIFAARTAPLIDFYRHAGANLLHLEVTANSTAEMSWDVLCTSIAEPRRSVGPSAGGTE